MGKHAPYLSSPRDSGKLPAFRFVHAADLHIDSPFSGLREASPEIASRLQNSTFDAFRNLIDLCLEERVDFLVIAGDIYDGADRSVRAQLRFRDGLAELSAAGIQTFIVHGNHDPLDGWQSDITWPEGVYSFGPDPEWRVVERAGQAIAQVQGVSYPTRTVTDNLAARFSTPPDGDLFSVGLLHCNLGDDPAHDNYAPCTVDDLVSKEIDYWALGHVHTRTVRREHGCTIAYPGNIQGRHPNERGARGCYLVDAGEDRMASVAFQPLDVVRWETVEVSIDGLPGPVELREAIVESVLQASGSSDGRDLVCRVTLTGRGPLHDELRREEVVADLLEETRRAMPNTPWVWVERIVDRTRADRDLASRARQDDFVGAALAKMDAASPEELRPLLDEVFSGRRGRLPAPSEEDLRGWLNDARWYVAELLEPER